MASTSAEIARQVASQPYANAARVRRDAESVVAASTTFLKVGAATFDGKTLLHLHGTMATVHRGTTYNTPVTWMFPLAYPNVAPIVHITCKPGMAFAQRHDNVRAPDGRVFHDCLSRFGPRDEIQMALVLLQSVFGKKPPLHAAPAGAAAARPAARRAPQPVAIARPLSGGGHGRGRGRAAAQPHVVSATIASSAPSAAERDLQRGRSAATASLRREYAAMHAAATAQLRASEAEFSALQADRQQLEIMEQTLRHRAPRLEQRVALHATHQTELARMLEESKQRSADDVAPEDLFVPTDVYSAQLLDELASASAYNDLLDKLTAAAGDDVVALDQFVKVGAKYSKKLFRSRALALKISATLEEHHALAAEAKATARGGGR